MGNGISVVGKIYVIGAGDPPLPVRTIVQIYDPATNSWTRGTEPIPAGAFGVRVLHGRIDLFGGYDTNNNQISVVQEYDPATDTWTRKADMPTPRAILSAATVNDKIYVIGGATNNFQTFLSTVEAFDPEIPSSVNPAGKLPTTWGDVKAKN